MEGIVFKLAKRLVVAGALAALCPGMLAHAACPKVGFTVVEPHASAQTRPLKIDGKQTIFVRRELITTTSEITELEIKSANDGDPDDVLILLKFTPAADQRLHDATTNRSGMRIAFLFNDEVVSNIVWQGPYGMYTGGTQLSIPHGMPEARKLMNAIQGCTAK
jgi:preprotein translocase subunit SecD